MRWIGSIVMCLALLLPPGPPATAARKPDPFLREVWDLLSREFVEPERLNTRILLEGSLRAAEAAIPSLLYELGADARRPRVRLWVNGHAREPVWSGDDGPVALPGMLEEIAALLAPAAPPDDEGRIAALLVRGALRALDPHSALLNPDAYGNLQRQAAGQAGDVGMVLGSAAALLTVEAALADSPAEKAGIRAGDRLLQINQRPALHLAPEDALGLIRGKVGTLVTLLVLRPGRAAPLRFGVRRGELQYGSVDGHVFREGSRARIGYLRVRSFQESTAAEVGEQLAGFQAGKGALLGIVLDLRGNAGGVLEQATRVADLFLDRGTIVEMDGPGAAPRRVQARWYSTRSGAPLAVLVDRDTASAAEIVAGALKLHHRALLIGAPTFGKNSIQSIYPLSDGHALKLSVARFYPMGERSLPTGAVTPHLVLAPVRLHPAVGTATGLLASLADPPQGLPTEGIPAVAQPLLTLPHLSEAGTLPAPVRPEARHAWEGDRDFALELARTLLRRNHPGDRAALFRTALELGKRERTQQERRIAAALQSAGWNWAAGEPAPPGALVLEGMALEVRPASGEPWQASAAIPADGTQARLSLTLRNRGALPLHRLVGRIEGDTPAGPSVEFPIGRLVPENPATVRVELPLPARLAAGAHAFTLQVRDGRGARQLDTTLLLPLRPRPRPRVVLELSLSEDGSAGSRGNGDGRAQPGETLALRVRLRNEGPGPLGEGRVWLHGEGEGASGLDLLGAWGGHPALLAGETGTALLLFTLPAQAAPHPLNLTLNLMSEGSGGSPSLELSGSFSIAPGRPLQPGTLRAPVLALEPPPLRQRAARLRLAGTAGDDQGVLEVLGFLNDRKIYYRAGLGTGAGALPGSRPVALEVELAPGSNLLEVIARDAHGLSAGEAYRVWRDDGRPVMLPGGGAHRR